VAHWAQEVSATTGTPTTTTSSSASSAPADPLIGVAIGNYRIVRLIGSGGMGSVYLLEHVRLPSTVAAVKLLKAHRGDPADLRERFTQEALVASSIGDDRVARPFDLGHLPDGTPYIMMEYVGGRTVSELIAADGPLQLALALHIGWSVADTIVLAHARGILHRDIKPSNIMVSGDSARPHVKVLDFGVARATGALKVADTADSVVI